MATRRSSTSFSSTRAPPLTSCPSGCFVQLREYFREDGIEEGSRRSLLRLLRKRFGDLPESVAERVKAANLATVDLWLDRILTVATLDEVLAES